jgi:hypothetical protein
MARHQAFEASPPPLKALVVARALKVEVVPRAHLGDHPLEEGPLLLFALAVRPLGRAHGPGDGGVEDQRLHTLRVAGGEHHGCGSSPRPAVDRPAGAAGGIHHGPDVIGLKLQDRWLIASVRQADAAHVEQDEARERCQPLEVADPGRPLPHDLEVRPYPRCIDQVDGAFPDHLEGDVNVVVDGVPDGPVHGSRGYSEQMCMGEGGG